MGGNPKVKQGNMQDEVIFEDYERTMSMPIQNNHGLSELVLALTEAGLHIENLDDYDEIPYHVLPDLI